MSEPAQPEPDRKNWTWVLNRACPQCRFDAATVNGDQLPAVIRDAVDRMHDALHRPDASARPRPELWSALEYGCHVRDVCLVFGQRLELMLNDDDPMFANWDQDDTALAGRYWAQQPGVVADELHLAGYDIAARFADIPDGRWDRPGRRSDGSRFTVLSIGRYFAHDLVHHVHDVGS